MYILVFLFTILYFGDSFNITFDIKNINICLPIISLGKDWLSEKKKFSRLINNSFNNDSYSSKTEFNCQNHNYRV